MPIGPRVLTTLSAAGRVVRASNDGGWTTSRPRWAAMAAWLGEEIAPLSGAEGVAGLVERWLHAFGPEATRLTEWLGGTRVVARFPSPLSKEIERSASDGSVAKADRQR